MKAICATSDGQIAVVERDRPVIDDGEALIKLICAPVNPADRMQIAGTYIVSKSPPFQPGLVGVGKVIDVRSGGLAGALLKNRIVVFAPGPQRDGTYAEYVAAPVDLCLPLPSGLVPEEAVNLLANGMTAVALLEKASQLPGRAMILTAAAGELGAMINAAAKDKNVTIINVVSNSRQVEALRQSGAHHVLNSSSDNFAQDLAQITAKVRVMMAVDAIAGDMTRILLDALPVGGRLVVIGRLSGKDIHFDGMKYLVGKHLLIEGFDVGEWLGSKSLLAVILASRKAAAVLRHGHATHIQNRVGFDELASDYAALGEVQSGGKTLLFA